MLPRRRPSLSASSDIFSQVWSAISDQSANGADSTGQVANFLINAGYSVATVSDLLSRVSQTAGATPQMLQAAQAERAWLQQYQGDYSRNNWVWPIAIIAAFFYFGSREK